MHAGVTQLVESQPSKLLVAGSSPVSRSPLTGLPCRQAHRRQTDLRAPEGDVGMEGEAACVAQLVEHFLGKEEVTGSIPVISSN